MQQSEFPDIQQILSTSKPDRLELIFAYLVETPRRMTPDMLLSNYWFKLSYKLFKGHQVTRSFLEDTQGAQLDLQAEAPEVRYACVFYRGDERVLEVYLSGRGDRGVLRYKGEDAQAIILTPALHKRLRSYEKRITG